MTAFSHLPPEIRNVMYEQLLAVDNHSRRRIPNGLAMFTVSKQLHQESSTYFYQNNLFAVAAPSTAKETASILPPIADRYLPFLRRLEIHAETGRAIAQQTHKAATAIAAVSCIGAHFDELSLLLGSPLSHLLNSRVDDSIMDASHPITAAIRRVLQSNVTKVMRIALENAWFAPGIAQALQADFGPSLEFYVDGTHTQDALLLERRLTGRYSSTHLENLGLADEDTTAMYHYDTSYSPASTSTPSSLPSSLCSAFADLDTFSVSSFELGSNDSQHTNHDEIFTDAFDGEQPFFTEDDIEEWSACTREEQEVEEDMLEDMEGLDADDEMEDISRDESLAFMRNMKDVAHHLANDDDVTYMTNFAPDLLLTRHHLAHLVPMQPISC